MQTFITPKGIFLYDGEKLYFSKVILTEKMLQNLPFYNGNLIDYYKSYVTDNREIKTRTKNITEKYIQNLSRRIKVWRKS